MQTNTAISSPQKDYTTFFAKSSFVMMCIRYNFSSLIENPIVLTLLLNLLIIGAINFRKLRYSALSFVVLALLTVYNKEVLALVDILALTYALRGVSMKYLIRVNAVVLAFYIITWLFLLEAGVIKDEIMEMPKGIAHTLGFKKTNSLGMLGFNIISTLFLISKRKNRWIVFILIPFINQSFYTFSISRTPMIGGYVLMLVMLLDYLKILRPWTRYFIAALPIFLTIVIIYISKNVHNYPDLNMLFTWRFTYYSNMLNSMSAINWIIGHKIQAGVIMDGSYLMILFSGGIIAVFVFWRAYIISVLYHWKRIYQFLPFILGMLSNGIGENTFSSCGALSVIFWFIFFSYSREDKNLNRKHYSKHCIKSF